MEVERFDDYFEGPAKIENLIWRFIPEDSARTIALEAKEVDFLFNVPTIDISSIEATEGLSIATCDSVNLFYLALNLEKAPFDNVLFRKAISAAINREDIVSAALNGYGSAAYTCVPGGLPGENTDSIVTFDVDAAKAYLAESGIDPSAVTIEVTATDDTRRLVGTIIQSNLNELGIAVNIVSQDYATFLTECSAGNYSTWVTSISNNTALGWMQRVYHTSQIGASNFSRFSDDYVDSMIDSGFATMDESSRLEKASELEAYLNDQCVIIPLYQDQYIRAFNSDLAGVNFNGCFFSTYHTFYWQG